MSIAILLTQLSSKVIAAAVERLGRGPPVGDHPPTTRLGRRVEERAQSQPVRRNRR
jgi:hypothetical protein